VVTYTATGGTITAGGLYTAGGTVGGFRVIATQQGGTLADTAIVTVTAPPPILLAVILTPATASVVIAGTRQFSVSGQWSDGSTSAPAVTYTATGGTISSSGLYTAAGTAGNFRVIATQQGGTLADTATVTITPPVLLAVSLTPASASVVTGGTRQFNVTGQWSDGSTSAPAVTYTATGGSITSAGLYTAGGATGSFQVIATQQSGALADTASVTVTLPVNGGDLFDVSMPASSTDQGGSGYWVGGQTYTDLWVSFAMEVITSPSTGLATQKMVIFRNTGSAPNQFGEMNQIDGQWIWNWLFTDPNKGNITLNAFGSVASGLGQWHTYKIHLQSHGTTTVTFGKDGVDNVITLTTAASPAGIPTTLTFGGTLNGGSGASHFRFDNIHIGTTDPGWP
jgi:hypothetical protein